MDIDLVYLWVNGNDPKWQANILSRFLNNLFPEKSQFEK